jgi:hypothetical protein
MADGPEYAIFVVCEAAADQRTACTLADRVLCERVDWIAEEHLPHYRGYCGHGPGDAYLKWTDMVKLADERRIFAHGFIAGRPREPDAAMAERALLLIKAQPSPPAAVLLIRDADKDRRRAAGYEQARTGRPWPFEVVVGVADPKRECWVLAGYEPRDDTERTRLASERQNLGFDPRFEAERLRASHEGAKHDAKRVLSVLTRSDPEREDACLREPSLDLLKQRGAASGLDTYLGEVEALSVHLFDPPTPR